MKTLQQLQAELKALSEKVEKALSEQPSITMPAYASAFIKPTTPTIQPFEGTKRVRIDKASSADYWYSHRVSEVFEVKYCRKEYYALSDKDYLYIYPQDCTEVEPKSQQKTIEPFKGSKKVLVAVESSSNTWQNDYVGREIMVEYYDRTRYVYNNHYLILIEDCDDVSAQPQQAWEKYPTFESCRDRTAYHICTGTHNIIKVANIEYGYPTESLAKYARAVMTLSTVAKKWNEGVEKGQRIYFPTIDANGKITPDGWGKANEVVSLLPFYFHSSEGLSKSIELFPNEWKDFFNAKN